MQRSRSAFRRAGSRSGENLYAVQRAVESLEPRVLFAAAAPYISEFVAGNSSGITDEDGAHSDWLELYNPTPAAVHLNNWSLTDDAANTRKWIFPDVTLDAGGYLVIFADDKDRRVTTAPLHTNFKLSSSGEYLGLYDQNQSMVYQFSPTFPAQTDDVSYGAKFTTTTLLPSGATSQTLIPTDNSLGSTWTSPSFTRGNNWITGPTGVGFGLDVPGMKATTYRANVSVGSTTDADGVINDPSRQASVTSEITPVVNYVNTGDGEHFGSDRTFPGLTINSDVDNFVLLATGTVTIPTSGAWTFGVNSDDGFRLQLTRNGQTYTSEYANPRGPSDTIQTFNLPEAGDYALRLVFFEQGGGSEVEMFAAQGTHGGFDSSFRLVGDTAGGGLAVHTPADGSTGGSGGSVAGTDVGAQMKNVNATAYVRVPFTVADPTAFESLSLSMQYDDGFVAYLNGVEIARRNAPASTTFNSAATVDRPQGAALIAENIGISAFAGALVGGTNVLAIQGLNSSASDSDFLVLPQIVGVSSDPTSLHLISTPTPGGPNSSDFVNDIAPVTFSVPHGIYFTAFPLSLADVTPGVTIRYTLDGSDPIATSTQYASALTISRTTILRASAFKPDSSFSPDTTQSYIFLADVKTQSPNGEVPGPGWPGSGVNGQTMNYGMDPDIVNSPTWGPQINAAFTQIPTISITTALPNLFDPSTGIYVNPGQDGRDWERPASVELIDPGNNSQNEFTIDAGIRIRGGASRTGGNPKHSFRLFFRDDYGGTLDFPLFGDEGAGEFHSVDLRTAQNYSWSSAGDPSMNFIAEVSSRDTEKAMGDPYTRTRPYQLYIDGQYWGLYQTEERPEADFAASYFGGNDSDYDVMKVEAGPYTVNPTDGNANAWNALWNLAKQGFSSAAAYNTVLGKDANGIDDPSLPVYVDVKNLQDYMLDIYWGGNLDAPISNFLGNAATNNFYAVRNRNVSARQGWQFFQHDAEHTLLDVNINRLGPYSAGDQLQYFNPQWLHQQLMANPVYRQQFIDRAQAVLYGNGALSVPNALARFQARADEMNEAIIGESARWGDSVSSSPLTKDNWSAAIADKLTNFIPNRTPALISQLRGVNWFPSIDAPLYKVNGATSWGTTLAAGDHLTIAATGGTIYYTTNGSDPQMPDGSINPLALSIPSGGQVTLAHTATLNVRQRTSGAEWSALNTSVFVDDVAASASNLAITEVDYNPQAADATLGETAADNNDYEFIELLNKSTSPISLKGLHFTAGIDFTFADDAVLAGGQRGVIVRNLAAFQSRYGTGAQVLGIYTGNLDGSGEQVTLVDATGATVASFTYDDNAPWPTRADGKGSTLELINTAGSYTDPSNWRASSEFGGTPGTAGTGPSAGVVINEVMTNGATGQKDSIELFNPTGAAVNIGGWYLSDTSEVYRKFRIPTNTTIAAGGYVLFDESNFNPGGGANTTDFALSSTGDDVFFLSADPTTGRFTKFIDDVHFGAAELGVSFGRYPNGTGDLYPMAGYTPAAVNTVPHVGPVEINEVMYEPASGGTEFVELKNLTAASVLLYDPANPANPWKFTSGINFAFPSGAAVPAASFALVVANDPAVFRSQYNVPAGVPVYGPFTGDDLADTGDNIILSRPQAPVGNVVPYTQVDRLPYGVTAPWPAGPMGPDGGGASLARLANGAVTPDPASWAAEASGGSPGRPNFGATGPASTVKGRYIFYNNSKFDNFDPAVSAADDGAIATDKTALIAGAAPVSGKFTNYSSYTRGLNGIMVDIAGLPVSGTLSAGDFTFRVGNNGTPAGWTTLATDPTVTVRRGAGAAGSDRVELTWPDGTIRNEWLQITILPTAITGLAAADVFYFGSALGDTGNDPTNANVDVADYFVVRDHLQSLANPVAITSAWDLNRDGAVDGLEILAVRGSAVSGSAALQLITLQPPALQTTVTKTPTTKTATTTTAPTTATRIPTSPTPSPTPTKNPTPTTRSRFGVKALVPPVRSAFADSANPVR